MVFYLGGIIPMNIRCWEFIRRNSEMQSRYFVFSKKADWKLNMLSTSLGALQVLEAKNQVDNN